MSQARRELTLGLHRRPSPWASKGGTAIPPVVSPYSPTEDDPKSEFHDTSVINEA